MFLKWVKNKRCTYEIILCRPNREQVCAIEYSDLSFNPFFDEFNELNITIPYLLNRENGKSFVNPCWNLIISKWLIYLEKKSGDEILHKEYFIIENPNFSGNEINSKSFKCLSYEQLDFNGKLIDGFKGNVAKRIYDPNNTIDERDNLPLGIMNYICSYKLNNTWKIGYVESALLNLERLVSFSGVTCTSALTTLGERFGCFFMFDNINKYINIYQRKVGALGENRGLIVSDDITSIDYLADDSGLKTRLFINGKNNVTFALWNPTGQRYVDDFSFYMNDKYMSKSLQNALQKYNSLIESKRDLFNKFTQLFISGDDSVLDDIQKIRDSLLWEKNFTTEQIEELTPFIHEEIIPVSEIADEKQLYEYALKYLKTISFIPVQISISSIDIFALCEHQLDWDKFCVGDFVNIYYKPFDLIYEEMRLVSYSHNPVSNTLQLEFSNIDELVTRKRDEYYFTTTLGDIATTVTIERDDYLAYDRSTTEINTKFGSIDNNLSKILARHDELESETEV